MLQFLYVVLPKQSFDSSTGQGERASVGRPFADRHLHDPVSLCNGRWVEIQTFRFVYFMQLLMKSDYDPTSARVIAVSRKTYLNSVEYYPLMPRDLTEQLSENHMKTIMQLLRTFHDYLHVSHKTMDHTQRLSNSYSSLILS